MTRKFKNLPGFWIVLSDSMLSLPRLFVLHFADVSYIQLLALTYHKVLTNTVVLLLCLSFRREWKREEKKGERRKERRGDRQRETEGKAGKETYGPADLKFTVVGPKLKPWTDQAMGL